MKTIRFTLNGRSTAIEADEERMLLWVLRTELGLTGTKFGCGEGFCGSCTVLVDGKAERSCQLPMAAVAGKKIVTIEGLAKNGELHPVQTAFLEHDALQCGFCTPGMILTAKAFLDENPSPSQGQVKEGMAGNLCRCTGYVKIIDAVMSAAETIRKGGQ